MSYTRKYYSKHANYLVAEFDRETAGELIEKVLEDNPDATVSDLYYKTIMTKNMKMVYEDRLIERTKAWRSPIK